ncbi:MAG: hypothetical protein QXG00_04130 [Candidatus Woesearchaeota archaeon]
MTEQEIKNLIQYNKSMLIKRQYPKKDLHKSPINLENVHIIDIEDDGENLIVTEKRGISSLMDKERLILEFSFLQDNKEEDKENED